MIKLINERKLKPSKVRIKMNKNLPLGKKADQGIP